MFLFLEGWGVLTNNHPASQKWVTRPGANKIQEIRPSYPGKKRNKEELTMYPTPASHIDIPR